MNFKDQTPDLTRVSTGAIECLKDNETAEFEVTNKFTNTPAFKVYKAADKKEEASGVGVKLDGKKITLTFTTALKEKTTVYIAVTDGNMLESNAVGFEVDLYKLSPNCKILEVTATANSVDIKATIGSGDGKEIGSAIPVTFPIAKENAEQVAVSLKLDSKTSIVNYKSSAAEITTICGFESPEKVQDDETDVADFKGAFDFTGDSKYLYVQVIAEDWATDNETTKGHVTFYRISADILDVKASDKVADAAVEEKANVVDSNGQLLDGEEDKDGNPTAGTDLTKTVIDVESKDAVDQAIVADIAGDNTAKGLIGGEKDDGYLTQIKGINKTLGDDADSINYYVPYLDLQVGTYTPGSETNTKASLTMEITPMYNIVASTASDAKDVVLSDGENDERVTAVKVTDSQGKVFAKELKGLTDVKVDLPFPRQSAKMMAPLFT